MSVPPEGLEEENLQRYFGHDAVRSWPVDNLGHIEQLVSKRDSSIEDLEQAELRLLKKGCKKQSRSSNGASGDSANLNDRDRPAHRSNYLVGKRIDTISRLREQLPGILSDLDQARRADSNGRNTRTGAIFVEYKDQATAHQAFQQVRHPDPFAMQPKYIGVQPKEVIWQNLTLDPSLRITYSYIAVGVAIAIIVLWSIPVGIIGTISNINYLTDKVRFLRFLNKLPAPILGLITGLVPPLLLSYVVSYVPYFFKWLATISGAPTTKEASKWAQKWNFVFQVVQVFLITTFSSGVAAVATKISNDPQSVPRLLAKNLPKASNFYLTYFIIQGIGSASKNIINYSDLFQYLFYYNVTSKTPRQKYNTYIKMKGISWFNAYPKFTNLAIIAIAYSCIAPLVLGFAAIGVYLFYLQYRYNLLYVVQVKTETKGESLTRALQQLMTGVYLSELCLLGLFGIKKAPGASTMMTVLLILTIIYHLTVNKYLAPLEHNMPIDVLSSSGTDEESPLLGGSSRPDRHPHSRILSKLPSALFDPLASLLEPHVFASQSALRPWLQDPEGESEEAASYTTDQLKNAYLNPALTSKTPRVWLPRDLPNGTLSAQELQENEKVGLSSTDQGAQLNEDGEVVWNVEDFEEVPIFKVPTRF